MGGDLELQQSLEGPGYEVMSQCIVWGSLRLTPIKRQTNAYVLSGEAWDSWTAISMHLILEMMFEHQWGEPVQVYSVYTSIGIYEGL
jgi:hypothetical protein